MWNHATGFNHTTETYLKAGERIWNLVRLFNLREGMDPTDDKLPIRLFKESFTKGQAKNILIKKEDFEKSLREYYALRGWNEKGIPTSNKLKELGLSKYEKIIN